MSDGPFQERDTPGEKPHWSSSKIIETATIVLVTATLSTVLNSGVTRAQIEEAVRRIDRQDREFLYLARDMVDLQKKTVELTEKLAVAQKRQDEQQALIIEMIKEGK